MSKKVLKTQLECGLLPKRKNNNFDMKNFSNFLKKNMTKESKMKLLLNAGVYNLNSPNTLSLLKKNFYGSETANRKTPEKVYKQALKNKNAKTTKKILPLNYSKKTKQTRPRSLRKEMEKKIMKKMVKPVSLKTPPKKYSSKPVSFYQKTFKKS